MASLLAPAELREEGKRAASVLSGTGSAGQAGRELGGAAVRDVALRFQKGNADNRQQAALSIVKLKILKFV